MSMEKNKGARLTLKNSIVLFTQRVEIIESYGERRDCADQRISEFISACGYIPVPVPNNARIVERIVGEVNPVGLVLTGGNSLVKYGGNAPERDETDKLLIEIAVRDRIPLFGFCRGMQSILEYFGNELVNVTGHVAVRHKIIGAEDTIEVNSYHHQGCIELTSDELEVLMISADDVIEKVKHKNLPIVGIMWHPEREGKYRMSDIIVFKELMEVRS